MSIQKMAFKSFLFSGILFTVFTSHAQSISGTWKKDLPELMDKFISCTSSSSTDTSPCSAFVGESIAKTYKVSGLYSEKSKRYLQMGELSKVLTDPAQWTLLGHAYDQKILTDAQDHANANKAVVAVYTTAEGISHIALILPGDLSYSGTWGFKVPNSASFVLNEPSKSYVGKGLSYAFTRNMIKDVNLYAKKY